MKSTPRPGAYRLLGLALVCATTTAATATPPAAANPPEHTTRIEGPRREADTTLGRDVLDRDAIPDLGAVLESEPGLRVTRLGGLGAFTTLSIRGSTAEQVMVLLDGIPLNGADGGPVDLSQLPLGPLAAIDIHRNFVPARLGVPALGGALVLRSRTPRAPELAADLGAGSFGTTQLRAHAGLEGISFHVEAMDTQGDFRYSDDNGTRWTTNDDATRTRRNNDLQRFSGLMRAHLALAPAWNLSLLHLTTLSERGLPGLGTHPTTLSTFDLQRHVTGLHLHHDTGALATALTLYHAFSATTVRDPAGELGPPSDRATLDSHTPGANFTLRLADDDATLPHAAEIHAAWRLEAADGTRIADTTRHLATAGLSGSLGIPAAHLRLHADVQLLAAINPDADTDLGDAARLGANWLPSPDHRLALTFTRTFRVPSLFERFGDTGLVLGNPELRPERAHGIEIAWETILASPTESRPLGLRLQLQTFTRWHDNLIQFLQNAQNVARPENIGAAFIAGAELELAADWEETLDARLTATALHTRDTSAIAARNGRALPLRPPLVIGASLGFSPHERLRASLEADWMSSNHLDAANLVETRPRLLLGATLAAHVDDVRIMLSVVNLLDNRVADLAGFPLPGLSAFASLRWEPTRP
jgi:iron complex outermembrane receptor protein